MKELSIKCARKHRLLFDMMNEEEVEGIAIAWNALSHDGKPDEDKHFWAFMKLDDCCMDEPEDAWRIIQRIIALNHDIKKTQYIAAGPIEGLLVYHGEKFIDRFEELAKKDVAFKDLLGGVWKNRISDEIWKRIQAASGPSW